jgi:PAS domain S-box-containing protein
VSDKRHYSTVASDVARVLRGAAHERGRLSAERLAGLKSNLNDGAGGASNPQAVASLVMVLAGIACLIVAFALLPAPLSTPQIFVAIGLGFVLIAGYLAFLARTGAGATQMECVGARIEGRLERLRDAQWELSENEARYRALLDSQEAVILRRDEDGRLTFANAAFFKMFGVTEEAAIGAVFSVVLREPCAVKPLTVADGVRRQRFAQHIVTAAGPRWIEWEEQTVAGPTGHRFEVQSVGRDVTEQRVADTQLAEARDQAESANRAKSRFLATMSHEIRTPMNGILGMASLMQDTEQTPEQQTYVRAIDQSARTLLALIDEILDFSKIEAGKLELTEEPFALDACVQGAVELLAPRAHEKGLEIAWSVSPHLPRYVVGDEARVRQILLNLISNAVKFTDTGGLGVRVDGTATPCAKTVRIEMAVEDTGIGLSAQDMRSLFREFEQADAAVQRRTGGTGLGLAISMRLARAMGGDIRVTSEPGRGATFTAAVSLQVADEAEEEYSGPDAVGGARVLLAFDRKLERRALREALAAAGVDVFECDFSAASAAVQAAVRDGVPFDRVVIDGAEGVSQAGGLLAAARDHNGGAGVRGIVLVNVFARSQLSEFRAVGFDAYLVRPVRPNSLMTQLGLRQLSVDEIDASRQIGNAGIRLPRRGVQRRVLLAEDNEINSLLARRVLEKSGYAYAAVTNGVEAVAFVKQVLRGAAEPVDLILMDIFMPQLDGMEAARAIRDLYAASPVAAPPIVALTANAFAEDRQRYLEAGMDDYLAKPFDRAGLEAVLCRWFGTLPGGDADAA